MRHLAAFAIGLLLFVGISFACLALAPNGGGPANFREPFLFIALFVAPLLSGFIGGVMAPRLSMGELFALGIAAAVFFSGFTFVTVEPAVRVDIGRMSGMGQILAAAVVGVPLLVITGGVLGSKLRQRLTRA